MVFLPIFTADKKHPMISIVQYHSDLREQISAMTNRLIVLPNND